MSSLFTFIPFLLILISGLVFNYFRNKNSGGVYQGQQDDQVAIDMKVVRVVYGVFINSAIICLMLVSSLRTISGIFMGIGIVVYLLCAVYLLVNAIKNIRVGKGYHMLGQFFVFLISPVFIGIGLCCLVLATGAVFPSLFKGVH
jgi:hypothetical protein